MRKNDRNKRLRCVALAILMLLVAFPGVVSAAEQAIDTRVKITLNPQSGTGGTLQIDVESGGKLPNITPPTRRGYAFAGYWMAASGQGRQYYDAQGAPTVPTCNFAQNTTLYAHWTVKTFTITYENMGGASFGTNAPATHTYGVNTAISDPTRADYNFFGWQINDSAIASRGLVLGATAYNADITLTAVWNKATLVTLVDNVTETVTMLDDDLRKVFYNQVTDPATHRYTDVRIYDWIPDACYTGGNNRVSVVNHSNADVSVDFVVDPVIKEGANESLLDGVEMVMNNENHKDGTPAKNVFLSKVPAEGADAPFINAYLRLNGSPIDPDFYKGLVTNELGYVQVADIVVIIGHLDGPRTPKK